MGYQPGPRSSTGRPRGFDKPKKAKTRKSSTHHAMGPRQSDSGASTLKDVLDRALAGLDNLGSQTFATPPFQQHFERWLKSLATIIDDFEASPLVKVDDRFREERGNLFSAVEAALRAEQTKEAERSAKILNIHGSKDALLQAEQEHEARLRELAARRGEKLKSTDNAIEALRRQLTELEDEKPGFLERFTKKKAQAEEELKARIASSEGVLNSAKASFDAEAKRLQGEYAERKQGILGKVAEEKRQIDSLQAEAEVDGSAEVRRVACEELSESVRALVERIGKAESE